jgi:hypothetical protein
MTKILPGVVEAIIKSCLFLEGEDTSDAVVVEGITATFGFHPDRLEERREVIERMLGDLPKEFMVDSGGGMSFLQACNDCDGNQWTGFHRRMEELFVLGMAIGKVTYCLPREYWGMLPGGVPYLQVDL